MPIRWAHSEYLQLLRSAADGKVFGRVESVHKRYVEDVCQALESWKLNRRAEKLKRGYTLRVQCPPGFRLRWSLAPWATVNDTRSQATALGIAYVDMQARGEQESPIHFTFWLNEGKCEGWDYWKLKGARSNGLRTPHCWHLFQGYGYPVAK